VYRSRRAKSSLLLDETPSATGAPVVEAAGEGRECRGLRQAKNRTVGQRCPMGVVAVRNPTHRVTEDLDRRFRHVLVIVCRARLAEILQHPGMLFTGVDVPLRGNAGQPTQIAEAVVRPAPATTHMTAPAYSIRPGRPKLAQRLRGHPRRAAHVHAEVSTALARPLRA